VYVLVIMSQFRFFFCLLPFIFAMGAPPVQGAVLAYPPSAAAEGDVAYGDLSQNATACCDPSMDENKAGDRIIIAQIFDIVTGAAKLLYNATDNTKEQEAAAHAEELKKQQEAQAQAEAKANEMRLKERDDRMRSGLSDPFAVSSEPSTISAGATGALPGAGNPNQVNISAMPSNSAMPPVLSDLSGQVSLPPSQAAAPVGMIVISMDQDAPPAAQPAAPITAPTTAPAATNNTAVDNNASGSQAGKVSPPPARKSDNPFDN
jgi:hypothetical protein